MSRIMGVMLVLCVIIPLMAEEGLPPGHRDLQRVEEEIAKLKKELDLIQAKIDDHRRLGEDWMEAKAAFYIAKTGRYRGPMPVTIDSYISMLSDQFGWTPTGPTPPDVKNWVQFRRSSHQLADEWERVRVAQLHLEDIRDRLRRQLKMEPAQNP